jgi:membrane associated rhomboid family serine protease
MGKIFTDIADVFKRNGNLATRLIIINVLVFFAFSLIKFGVNLFPDSSITAAHIDLNTLVSQDFITFISHPWALLFHPFTQNGLFSLLFDLIIIYWFGNMLADFIGGRKMVITYLSGALFSVFFFSLVWGIFTLLNKSLASRDFLYGASAGSFAIMFAYVALNQESEVMIFTFRVKVRILVLVLLVISIFRSPPLGVLDLGGAVFGYTQMKLLRSGINLTSGIEKLSLWLGDLFKPKSRPFQQKFNKQQVGSEKGKIISFNSNYRDANPTQEEVDFLLDKINKEGYESLSKEEKIRLHKASQSAD